MSEMIERIMKASGKSRAEVEAMVAEKQEELSGLVSFDGAAYIIAKEMNINVAESREMKAKDLLEGTVDIKGKIVKMWDAREFDSKGNKGKVMNVTIGDSTGTFRLSLWNEEIERFGMEEGDSVLLSKCWAKKDNRGSIEVRLGRSGKVSKIQEEILSVDLQSPIRVEPSRNEIAALTPGSFAEVRGSIVQVYRRSPFFYQCSECGGRVEKKGEEWTCQTHGIVKPSVNLVVSGVMDDGTGNIRVAFFRNIAEKVMGKTTKEVDDVEEIYERILGKEFVVRGIVRVNKVTENPELIASDVTEVDVEKECKGLLEKLKNP